MVSSVRNLSAMPFLVLLAGLAVPLLTFACLNRLVKARWVEGFLRPRLQAMWSRYPWTYDWSAAAVGGLVCIVHVGVPVACLARFLALGLS